MQQEQPNDWDVCIMGLGYVGLTLAITMADVGFRVIGVEIRKDICHLLEKGHAHFREPGLDDKIQRVTRENSFKAMTNIPRNWQGKVFIITVGTPLNTQKESCSDMIENVAREISIFLKDGDLVIMRSTVKLGTTRQTVLPILDKSRKKYDLAFCPERTIEGKALIELRQLPQIVGGTTKEAMIRASQLFQHITPTVIRVSDVETAEMIKLIDNTQRDVAFAYANEVARVCDAIGISATEVIQAGKLGYPRTNLPMPGLVGGPCLEKDSYILTESLKELGVEPKITMAARYLNERQPGEVIGQLKKMTEEVSGFPRTLRIVLLGLAFKGQPATDDLRGTMARPLLEELRRSFPTASFYGFDAVVPPEEIQAFGLQPIVELEAAFQDAHLILIVNNHPLFSMMPIEDYMHLMQRPGLVYDFWNGFKSEDLHLPKEVGYMALGSHGKIRFGEDQN